MVELTAYGHKFELDEKTDIKYTKQISDIFELASISSSYTNSFSIPKTPNNTMIMEQLGIVGDTSQVPYSKVPSNLSNYGYTIFNNGWLSVKDTTDRYNISCMDGVVDFFKMIENKTMGIDLNLSNFNHEKNIATVIASFDNEYYKYIFADYNGKNEGIFEDEEGINIDYQVPDFNIGKLFELVMNTFGQAYDPVNIEDINDLYITYPKNPADVVIESLAASFYLHPFLTGVDSIGGGYYTAAPSQRSWTTSVINEGSLVDNWKYVIEEDGAYRVQVSTEMYAYYESSLGPFSFNPMNIDVLLNGVPIISFMSDPYALVSGEISLYLSQGDIIEYSFKVSPYEFGFAQRLREIHHNGSNLAVYKTNQGNVNLSEAFKDYQIKDFIKEVFIRMGVIPVINSLTKVMRFVPIDELLDTGSAVDWTDKYVRRIKESYVQGSYAQKNIFRHKYNDELDISQNGYLNISNQNLEAEKDLYQSKIYAPELVSYIFPGGVLTKKYKIWERETKEDAEGNLSIDYKGLNGRFYIVKYKLSPVGSYRMVSEVVGASELVEQYPYADSTGTTFDQIVPEKYSAYLGVLNNFRAHEIELALSIDDVIGLDLTRPYYIKQEGMYYILNRIMFNEGKTLVGEFIRINKVLN